MKGNKRNYQASSSGPKGSRRIFVEAFAVDASPIRAVARENGRLPEAASHAMEEYLF